MKVYVCEVFDHAQSRAVVQGLDIAECSGDAYDACMKWLNDQGAGNNVRYEFSCTEDSIDFQWRMTEEDYEKFRKDTEPNEDMDYCGAVYFG